MPKEKGFAHLVLLFIVLILMAIAGYFVFIKKLPVLQKTQTSSSSSASDSSLLKTKYQNPFDKKASYNNPFSGYKNPFDNLSQ